MNRIVLTGGPGAGKSVIAAAIAAGRAGQFVHVPEAATQVYARLRTRWDRLDADGRQDVQRRIFRLQLEQEDAAAAAHPGVPLLLDRGTVDGAAYWPDGPDAYWSDLGTTLDAQLARYDLVIWLETAATLGLYDGEASNFARFEDPATAIASGKALLRLWSAHPNLRRVGAFSDVNDKIVAVREILAV
ncbi:MAG TPA: AAA family ATPase [Tepidisphaeraceae bacterium]|nr:AAA family ATPase [Tepidisphaeraceae bacterium]